MGVQAPAHIHHSCGQQASPPGSSLQAIDSVVVRRASAPQALAVIMGIVPSTGKAGEPQPLWWDIMKKVPCLTSSLISQRSPVCSRGK